MTFRRVHNMYSNFSNFKIMTFTLEVDLLFWRVAVAAESISRCALVSRSMKDKVCGCFSFAFPGCLCYRSTWKLCFFSQLLSYICNISIEGPAYLLSVPLGR